MAPAPTWRSRRDDPGRTGSIIFGVILVAVGLWFFADQTLGLDMPRLRWSELWPTPDHRDRRLGRARVDASRPMTLG